MGMYCRAFLDDLTAFHLGNLPWLLWLPSLE